MTGRADVEKTRLLRRLAFRLRSNADFMASVLAVYQSQEKLDDPRLARQLRMQEDRLPLLGLCKRPNSESEQFASQVRQLSQYTGADVVALAQVIRQVEALASFGSLPADTASIAPLARSASPFLAAARDRHKLGEQQDEYRTDEIQGSDETDDADSPDEEGE